MIKEAYRILAKPENEFDAIGMKAACKLRRTKEYQRNIAENVLRKVLYYVLQNKSDPFTSIYFLQKPLNIRQNTTSNREHINQYYRQSEIMTNILLKTLVTTKCLHVFHGG